MATRPDNSGFSVFALDPPQDVRTMRKKLEFRRAELAAAISGGLASDWANYQRRVGVLEGIDEALQVCEDIDKAERA